MKNIFGASFLTQSPEPERHINDAESDGIKISVVVIAKNAEATIQKCLDSVVRQTRLPDDVVVVVGDSSDRTRDIVSSYPCKLISSPGKDTYGSARNKGVAEASGNVIAFLDADDYADQNWIACMQVIIKPRK